ncbi:MAG: riboflavin synthase [Chromatiales bacterium]|nr:riboflavin synthase [Chromatiales bacterium]
MFTGIVQAVGKISALDRRGDDMRLSIESQTLDFSDVGLGDSIAVSGVCLSAVEVRRNGFAADVSRETLSCTTLGALASGEPVNLEKALLPTTRLGGHLVSGHVDGVGQVEEVRSVGQCKVMRFTVPAGLARYLAAKGSVCVDGVSLTVNTVSSAGFEINVIPHTLERTVLGNYRSGTAVNIEVDVVARYLERLLSGGASVNSGGIGRAFLSEHGYLQDA